MKVNNCRWHKGSQNKFSHKQNSSSHSLRVVNILLAGGPEPSPLLATREQKYSVFGENPVAVRFEEREEGERGREEGEGEQERV